MKNVFLSASPHRPFVRGAALSATARAGLLTSSKPSAARRVPSKSAHSAARPAARRTKAAQPSLSVPPARSATVEEYRMHEEWYTVPPETADAVRLAKREGRPVLAVGTTSLRTLESAFVSDPDNPDDPDGGSVAAGTASTSIFIYPGYRFRVVDRLFTNFHTPKSTLFMLVSAFAGEARIRNGYEEAIAREYRFFSYGDAMLIQ